MRVFRCTSILEHWWFLFSFNLVVVFFSFFLLMLIPIFRVCDYSSFLTDISINISTGWSNFNIIYICLENVSDDIQKLHNGRMPAMYPRDTQLWIFRTRCVMLKDIHLGDKMIYSKYVILSTICIPNKGSMSTRYKQICIIFLVVCHNCKLAKIGDMTF